MKLTASMLLAWLSAFVTVGAVFQAFWFLAGRVPAAVPLVLAVIAYLLADHAERLARAAARRRARLALRGD